MAIVAGLLRYARRFVVISSSRLTLTENWEEYNIRHRAERYKPEILPEIIFDLGIILTGNSLVDAREARLRKRIEENPYAALSMSNLGGILVQKQKYQEAERWLRKAYELRNSLPDNGKRTLMLLHEVERKSDRILTGENG